MANVSVLDQRKKFENIQFLRFIAASSVIVHHVPTLPSMIWGVDLFFLISGFIMCYVSQFSVDQFFIKRCVRVLPLYWISTLGVFSIALIAPALLNSTTANYMHLIKSLLFIPFDKNGSGVFPILYVGWTLNYEMFFYFIFYIALLVSHKYRAVICALMIATLCLLFVQFPESLVMRFWSNSNIVNFLTGVFVYVFLKRDSGWIMQCLMVLFCMFVVMGANNFAYLHRFVTLDIPLMLGFSVMVVYMSNFPLLGVFVLLGDASYALYLSHSYVVQVIDKKTHLFEQGFWIAGLTTIGVFCLCYLVAILIWLYFEKPLDRILKKIFLKRKPEVKLSAQGVMLLRLNKVSGSSGLFP
jgi:exopolysaccharide production protein ExoZ